MATSEPVTSETPAAQPAPEEASGDTALEATVADETPARSRVLSPPASARARAAAAAAGGALALLVVARLVRRGEDDDEHVLFSSHPRKVFWRYASTLGLWELSRRATQFRVVDGFVVVHRGVLRRTSRSLPLSVVRDVHVARGPWQGFVEVRGADGREVFDRRLGPFRAPKAQELARIIGRQIAR